MKLILASKSPRRIELMHMLGFSFDAVPSDVLEIVDKYASPSEFVEILARRKSESVFSLYPDDCVIGCDTIVVLNGEILGKPETPERAVSFLQKLSGKKHTVYTGICVMKKDKILIGHDKTSVVFSELTDSEIRWYVSTGEPLDKAGAYGIQGPAALFINSIEGNYFNVVGLPVSLLYQMLKTIGYPVLPNQDE